MPSKLKDVWLQRMCSSVVIASGLPAQNRNEARKAQKGFNRDLMRV